MLHYAPFAFLVPLALAIAHPQEAGPPTPVAHVDLKRYAGLWHEIARIPNRFQNQCAWGVTAEYALRRDGRIDVINRCYKKDGNLDQAKGLARVVDTTTNSKLKVSFFSIIGWRPVWGDYWIIDLADDYSYAVVCSPDRKYGWILARETQLPADVLEGIRERLRQQAFDPSAFQATLQEAPVPGR
ncbi:MAG: lipocalin family protein [Gemmatimonadota bacterium]